jgi:phosphoglucomutase
MDQAIIDKAKKWLESDIDDQTRQDIEQMLSRGDGELVEAFYKDLEFGTGGLRGIIGTGSNRMNKYTVGAATQGLSNYLKKTFTNVEISVAIAHDSRIKSDFFAEITATVFSANGIKVYFFKELRPTPELSYAIRHLGCKSGVVITASHNPKEYNGYKAYWDDGAQMIAPHDINVISEVNKIKDFSQINFNRDDSRIVMIGDDIDRAYKQKVQENVLSPNSINNQSNLKIVYSSIHGTGITLVPDILKQIGFKTIYVVEEQAQPDGNFPTVVYPNPEEPEAMSLALEKAKELNADIVMATDPDADRVGIAVKNHHNQWQLLNGNQTGSLIIYYLLRLWKEKNKLDGNQFIVKTIVTTDLIQEIARHYDVEYFNTLTGFKYIAALIRDFEGRKKFIGGGEESYGYLINDFVRDKDAITSCAVVAEMTAYAKDHGMTLMDMLMELYQRFGFYRERMISITKKGISGAEEIRKMMADLRTKPPRELGGSVLTRLIDYEASVERDMKSGNETAIDYPKSNVLQFLTADGTKISARPSGTEPKIKFYFSVKGKLQSKSEYDESLAALDDKIDRIIQELNLESS